MQTYTPPIFLQTRYTTCGVACLMMALSALGSDIKLTKGTEGDIFRELRARGYDLVPVVSLAAYASKRGYTVTALIEDSKLDFWSYWRNTDPHMYEAQELAYARARTAGTSIVRRSVSIESMKESLSKGHLIIAGINLGDGVKHALLVYGWDKGFFNLIDPLSGMRKVPENELYEEMQMEFGRWFLEIH
jgi:hypothetical protein